MKTRILALLMLIVLLTSAACAPQATPAAELPAPTAVPPTVAPPAPQTLTVLAAASLTESFTELGKAFEAQNPGVTVVFSFAGSQQLAQQLDQGAAADVFARISADAAQPFARNRLVVIFPKDNPAGIRELQDLSKAGLKLDLGDKAVPCGQYALDFLDKAIKDPGFDPTYKDSVIKNVVSYEDNVKAIITKVSMGEADAGIVYVTDVTTAVADKLGTLDIPDALYTIAPYPIAPVADSKNADLAKAFVAFILSPDGQAVLAKYGFLPVK
ncbi:MAG: molybdate ABC transporter substrate-binding protein [Chloroflexi bacterium]|nr:molybdate ABC transporter substrate-binding protein [Chloroflexota bacterium]